MQCLFTIYAGFFLVELTKALTSIKHNECLQPLIFLHRIKARTFLLRIQIPVSYDECFREDGTQLPEQCRYGRFLFRCPCIRGYAAGRQASFIADADGMAVVVLAMRSCLFYRSATVDPAIARDVKMVTDIVETAVPDMVMAAGLEIQVPPLGGGGTMDDDECYFTHTGLLNAALYTYDAAYGGCHCDDDFQDDAPRRFLFLFFHNNKVLS